jgi:transposase
MAENELTDEQWATIQSLIPEQQAGPGKPRADDRETLDAILYVASTGCRWEDLDKTDYSYSYTTPWRRLRRWEEDGTWKKILDALVSKGYSLGLVKMDELSIDSTTVPAKKGEKRSVTMVTSTSRGRRGHAVATKDSLPVALAISAGNVHEGRKLIPLMESISIETRRGHRPRRRPKTLYADTKYNMPLNKFYLDKKHVRSQMPEPPGKKARPGRPRAFDKSAYNRVRPTIERFNGWIKAFRRVAVRYDRLPQVYTGFVHLASIMVYLRILQ